MGRRSRATALLIYPTTNTTNLHHLFCQSVGRDFPANYGHSRGTTPRSWPIRSPTPWCLAAQDFSGNVLTNNQNNRVIHLTLEFYQPARFLLGADYYKLETSMTRRALQ